MTRRYDPRGELLDLACMADEQIPSDIETSGRPDQSATNAATRHRPRPDIDICVDEQDSTCCYAKQDKFWVQGAPDGEHWEIYTVLADSATFAGSPDAGANVCCGTDHADATAPKPAAASCC